MPPLATCNVSAFSGTERTVWAAPAAASVWVPALALGEGALASGSRLDDCGGGGRTSTRWWRAALMGSTAGGKGGRPSPPTATETAAAADAADADDGRGRSQRLLRSRR